MPGIFKTFYTPAGKDFSVENAKTNNFTIQIKDTDLPHAYDKDFVGRIDSFIFIPQVENNEIYTGEAEIRPLWSSREFKYKDGSVGLDDKNTTKRYIPFTLEVNGRIIGKNFKSEVKIKYLARKKQTFVHIISYTDKNDEAIYGKSSFNIDNASIAYPWIGVLPECGAQFHFVDDLQYRKATNIIGNGELPQRSADEPGKFSTKPFKNLNLTDLKKSIIVEKLLVGNNQVISRYIPLLNFADKPVNSVKRPTMNDLKNTSITGYLYYSNDIDTPKDGTFTTKNADKKPGNFNYGIVRDKDDNQVTTKHYYVTFRVVPTQLVVKYKKSDGTFESNAKYELLDSKNTQISNQFAAASGDVTASSKDALAAMMKLDKTTFIKYSNGLSVGYLSKGAVYLLPGKYVVKPTVKAPEGYEWVVDSTGKNSKTSADISIGLQTGNATVAESVTFVLKKKPTPPTPPAPTPEPEPEPTPEPEPDIDWDDIPDIDLTPDKEPEPTPVPDLPVPVAPAPILPPAEAEPEPAPAPAQPEQPEQQAKHVAKHLPKTGSTATPILASAIASLFAGLAGLAESFAANRKRRN